MVSLTKSTGSNPVSAISQTGESPVNKSFKERKNIMKNILSILADAGVEVTDEQKKSIEEGVKENYKPVDDWQKQHDKVQTLEATLRDTKEKLKEFEGVDVASKDKLIEDLKEDLAKKEADYQSKIADRDFQDMLKESIASVHGKNAKAITALLDLETLKASKNQKEDVAAALKTLAEAEDSKMLFGEPEPNIVGQGNPIGTVNRTGNQNDDAAMRAAMGLPPVEQK